MKLRIRYLKEQLNRNSETILILLLILFFLTEAITKVTVFSNLRKIEIQAGVKVLVLGMVLIGLAILKKRELLYIAVLSVLFIIGQLNLPSSINPTVVVYFMKYIFPIALLGFFMADPQKPKLKLLNLFEYILLFNSILIFVGLLLDTPQFRTYQGPRFGYNGVLVSSATSTYFYIIGLCHFMARYHADVIKNWKFWFIAVAAVIVGTKSIILVLAALSIFYIIKYIPSRIFKLGLLATIISIALGFGYYLFFINPLFQSLTQTEGLLTSFLSLRDQLFMDFTLPYIQENWNIWNYLFGGVSNFELRSQMELLDAFFFWGILGSMTYLYFYSKSFFQYKVRDIVPLFILILILIIILLAGNFFYNTSVVIYIIILRETLMISSSITSRNHKNYQS